MGWVDCTTNLWSLRLFYKESISNILLFKWSQRTRAVLLHFISRHHRDDDVPISVICSGKSSWLRLLLVCHHAVWRLSIHLLLLLDACHCRTPLNCERGVNIIISLASFLINTLQTHWHTQRWCTSLPAKKAPSGISHWFLVKVIFLWSWKQPLCASFF